MLETCALSSFVSVCRSGFIQLQGLHKYHSLLFYLILYLHSLSPIHSCHSTPVVRFPKKFGWTVFTSLPFSMCEYVVMLLSDNFAKEGRVLSAARTSRPNQVFVPGAGEFDYSLPHNRRDRRGTRARHRAPKPFSPVTPPAPVFAPPPSLGTAARGAGFDSYSLDSVAYCDSDFDFADFGFF
jgi:hypothetical protein